MASAISTCKGCAKSLKHGTFVNCCSCESVVCVTCIIPGLVGKTVATLEYVAVGLGNSPYVNISCPSCSAPAALTEKIDKLSEIVGKLASKAGLDGDGADVLSGPEEEEEEEKDDLSQEGAEIQTYAAVVSRKKKRRMRKQQEEISLIVAESEKRKKEEEQEEIRLRSAVLEFCPEDDLK